MDQNSFNSHSTRSTFFSRVYPTPQSSYNPGSYPSTTRPHTNVPSFFGKGHIPHSAGRNPENHIASEILQGGDGSALLPPASTEDGSIYVGHKYPPYLSRGIEATNSRHPYDNMDSASHVSHSSRLKLSLSASRTGAVGKHRQCRSPDDLAGDTKQNLGGEMALFAGPRLSNPNSALTPYDHPFGSGCASPRIVPKVEEGGEEDGIPVSIKKSFKELRSVKDELERQRGENERLRAELATTGKEALDNLARLDEMKQLTKRSIESTSDKISELRKELDALKSQSDESFAFAAQARSALPDVNDLRVVIKNSSENCHRVMEDLAKAADMNRLIQDLKLECANARKANDFLRDKLTDITSQYTDAMERLESSQYNHANQTNALRVAVEDLHNASLLAASSTAKLDTTQKELSDALTACALAKESIAQLEKRIEKLIRDAEEKSLVTITLQRENAELQILLKDRETSVTSVLSLKEEIITMLSSSSEQQSELDTLRKTSAGQMEMIGELNGKCYTLERENEGKETGVSKSNQ
ncbi:hypothetical protein F5888DRAFT_453967 [Russula emetica]|nr:hypothetical protein F5888DRAFT_453967 [Russula emetica]